MDCFPAQSIITQHIKGMHIRVINISYGLYACLLQILYISQRLSIEGFAISDEGIAWRQIAVIGLVCRGCVGRYSLPGILPQI